MTVMNALSVPLAFSASPTRWFSSTTANALLLGTAGPDSLSASGANSTLIGGAGDDTYTLWTNSSLIIEEAGGGIDTLVSYSLRPVWFAHLENMEVRSNNAAARGNELDNIVIGGSGAQTLSGGFGNDVLMGGAGADLFVIRKGEGSDVITDFTPGTDRLRLEAYGIHSFAAFQAAMTQAGSDTIVNLGDGEVLVLRNLAASALTAGDVMLPIDPSMPGMRLTFNEEFDGFSASATGSGTVWKTTYKINDQLRTLSSNKEAQYYSDSSVGVNPFSVQDGILTITAAPGSNPLNLPYNSGAITTAKSFGQQYGYFEVRAQLPAGQGFWPAFWLLPTTGAWPPEIDIFEVLGHDTGTIHTSLHSTVVPKSTLGTAVFTDVSAGFHTYGLDWQADKIRWYFDGTLISEATTPSDMRQPMYMLLNLAVGDAGSWPGQYDPGMPTGRMLIDYVRVWQTGSGATLGSWVLGPDDVAGFGGTYTLKADGTGATYNFSKSMIALRMDSTAFATSLVHTFTGTMLGDVVIGGSAQVNGSLGQGDDIFYFGPGLSRVNGNAGNDTFVFTAGQIGKSAMILDFRADLSDGGEHDLLRFEGFSAAARLDYAGTSASNPTYQYYKVVDGAYVSPVITVVVVNTTAPLSTLDYVFAN